MNRIDLFRSKSLDLKGQVQQAETSGSDKALTKEQRKEITEKVWIKSPSAVKALANTGVIPTKPKDVNVVISWCARHGISPGIVKAIAKNSNVFELEINFRSKAGKDSGEYIKVLSDCPNVTSLAICNIQEAEHGEAAALELVRGIRFGGMSHLKSLSLKNVCTSAESMCLLSSAIGTKPCHLHTLEFCGLTISGEGDWLASLAKSLTLNERLTDLKLIDLSLSDEDFANFCSVANSGCCLISLDVSGNHALGSKSSEAFSKLLKDSGRIVDVGVSRCHGKFVADLLWSMPDWIQSLDCSEATNQFSGMPSVPRALAMLIDKSKSLVSLEIRGMEFYDAESVLKAAFKKNKSLVRLDISNGKYFTKTEKRDFRQGFGESKTLEYIKPSHRSLKGGLQKHQHQPHDSEIYAMAGVTSLLSLVRPDLPAELNLRVASMVSTDGILAASTTPQINSAAKRVDAVQALKGGLSKPSFFTTCEHFKNYPPHQLTKANIEKLEDEAVALMKQASSFEEIAHFQRVLDALGRLQEHRATMKVAPYDEADAADLDHNDMDEV